MLLPRLEVRDVGVGTRAFMAPPQRASDATSGDATQDLADDAVVGGIATAERAIVAAEVGLDLLEGRLALATASVAALRTAARRAGISIASPSVLVAARPAEERELLADAVAERVSESVRVAAADVRRAAMWMAVAHKPYLTTREAAIYCGYVDAEGEVSTDGIRSAVADGKVTPSGTRGGGRGSPNIFAREDLDRFLRMTRAGGQNVREVGHEMAAPGVTVAGAAGGVEAQGRRVRRERPGSRSEEQAPARPEAEVQ
jgi:hypothetical protein